MILDGGVLLVWRNHNNSEEGRHGKMWAQSRDRLPLCLRVELFRQFLVFFGLLGERSHDAAGLFRYPDKMQEDLLFDQVSFQINGAEQRLTGVKAIRFRLLDLFLDVEHKGFQVRGFDAAFAEVHHFFFARDMELFDPAGMFFLFPGQLVP